MDQRLRCGLYVPRGIDPSKWSNTAADVAAAEGWAMTSLVNRWDDLARLLCDGTLQLGLVPSMAHLPPDRTPRLVSLDEWLAPAPLQRRPAITWRQTRRGLRG